MTAYQGFSDWPFCLENSGVHLRMPSSNASQCRIEWKGQIINCREYVNLFSVNTQKRERQIDFHTSLIIAFMSTTWHCADLGLIIHQ